MCVWEPMGESDAPEAWQEATAGEAVGGSLGRSYSVFSLIIIILLELVQAAKLNPLSWPGRGPTLLLQGSNMPFSLQPSLQIHSFIYAFLCITT